MADVDGHLRRVGAGDEIGRAEEIEEFVVVHIHNALIIQL